MIGSRSGRGTHRAASIGFRGASAVRSRLMGETHMKCVGVQKSSFVGRRPSLYLPRSASHPVFCRESEGLPGVFLMMTQFPLIVCERRSRRCRISNQLSPQTALWEVRTANPRVVSRSRSPVSASIEKRTPATGESRPFVTPPKPESQRKTAFLRNGINIRPNHPNFSLLQIIRGTIHVTTIPGPNRS
jgi:hypothetical protein